MSIVTARPPTKISVPRLLTVEDLAVLPSDLPSGPVRYELDNGSLIIMPPPGDLHGAIENKFAGAFLYEGERRGFGKARCGEIAIVLWRNPDRVVGADAVFIANSSLPIRLSKEGYLETIPDLVVEVRSKNDTDPEINQKVADYLRAGVKIIWVADPDRRTVTAYSSGQPERIYIEDDTLSVEHIIPGFRLAVRDVFAV